MNIYFGTLFIMLIILMFVIALDGNMIIIKDITAWAIGIFSLITLVGGAIYFTSISLRDFDKRKLWSNRAFEKKDNEQLLLLSPHFRL